MKFLIALWAVALLTINTAHAETITMVADMWCPYNCEPASDKPGFIIEVASRAFAKHNIHIEYKTLPWSRAIEETRAGNYNAIVAASRDDAPDFIFPDVPQSTMRNAFFVKSDSAWRFDGMASLSAISLGTIDDYSYSPELDRYIHINKNNMKKVQIISGDNALDANIKKLMAGRIGAFIEAEYVVQYRINGSELAGKIKEAGLLPATNQDTLFIAFSPANPQSERYAKILSEETDAMRKSGELKEIMTSYGIKNAGL